MIMYCSTTYHHLILALPSFLASPCHISAASNNSNRQGMLWLRLIKRENPRLARFLMRPEMEDKVQLIRTITQDTESKSGTWFWNDSANESGSDTEEGEENNNENESDSFS